MLFGKMKKISIKTFAYCFTLTFAVLRICLASLSMTHHIWSPDFKIQGTKIFQYCTCPAGRVTYRFHSSCKDMHLSFICNKEHKGVICSMTYKVPYITAKMIFTQSVS